MISFVVDTVDLADMVVVFHMADTVATVEVMVMEAFQQASEDIPMVDTVAVMVMDGN